jgi:phosphoribosyl 1,2-cyclic phosphodiesterase
MAVELCVLASGSGGNCTVVRAPTGVMLIDAGVGPRATATRMSDTGVRVRDVSAICLTHLDRDHFGLSWVSTVVRHQIRVFCHASRVADVAEITFRNVADAGEAKAFVEQVVGFEDSPFQPLAELTFLPVHLAHDRDGSHGFVADGFGRRIGYATDLGHVSAHLLEMFCGVDVLCIESNYDPQMQEASPRPWFLKQRIMGGRGHLSNQQAFDAVRTVLDRCQRRGLALPEHVVLLHRSRHCNCPDLLRALFSRDARIAPRLTLTEQFHRTEWIRPGNSRPLAGEQLRLAWA